MSAQNVWLEIVNCMRRVVRSNFQQEQATPGERVKLATAAVPLTDPLVQNYAVWRKSVLWIAAIALGILTLIQIISFRSIETMAEAMFQQSARMSSKEALGKENIETIDAVFIMILISHVVGTVLVFWSAAVWHHLPLSKRLARAAWLTMFLTPFLISAMPLTSLLNWDHLRDPQFRMGIKQLLGGGFALYFFMLVGPKAISLFAGAMRSSMTLKTLLPESATPGWAAVLVAPLYSLFLIVMTTIVLQSQGNIWLLLGMVCLMVGPWVYIWYSRDLTQPHTPDEMTVLLRKIRLTVGGLTSLGVIFIIVFVAVVGFFSFWDAVKFFLGLVSSFMALTVVASDFILALVWKGYEQSKRFQGTQWQKDLEAKFDALSTVGLTKFASSHAAPPPKPVAGMPAPPPPVADGAVAPLPAVNVSLETVSLDEPAGNGPKVPPPPPPGA